MASRTTPLLSSVLRQVRPRTALRAPLANLQSAAIRPSPSSPSPRLLLALAATRAAHSIPRPPPVIPREPSSSSDPDAPKSEGERPPVDRKRAYYQLSFTCVPCGHRSHHNVSKQGYHTGSTLITCPECRNRHVISDHLGIFTERKGITIEDIVREKGQLVKRGSLGEDGDIEFWPDESQAEDTSKDQ
ncbi:hypothetical protein ACO1O0_001023 [Amphichorda felina]